ncbi:MAG TPA: hypothetical protein VFZ48_04430 [Candidatus Saccharimonadales bacterium]
MSSSPAQRLVIAEARRRKWGVREVGSGKEVAIITNTLGKSLLFKGGRPPHTSANGLAIAHRKRLSIEFIEHLGFRMLPYSTYTDHAKAMEFLANHHTIVVKPDDAERGSGVTVEVASEAALRAAIKKARAVSDEVILQKFCTGRHYRLLAVMGQIVAAAERKPPCVVGDGRSTVLELVTKENQNPLRKGDSAPLAEMDVAKVASYLGKHANEIPASGESRTVLPFANLSSGGESLDVTDRVHRSYKDAAKRICESLGLFTCGIDIITDDIGAAYDKILPIIEINSKPGYRLHHFPTQGGPARNVAAMVLDAAFNE